MSILGCEGFVLKYRRRNIFLWRCDLHCIQLYATTCLTWVAVFMNQRVRAACICWLFSHSSAYYVILNIGVILQSSAIYTTAFSNIW